MDWKRIEEEHPKAWNELLIWIEIGVDYEYIINEIYILRYITGEYISPRILYDFFDEHDLFIEILGYKVNNWAYDIYKPYDDDTLDSFVANNDGYMNRTEAEEAAFTKAFELLENKLNKK